MRIENSFILAPGIGEKNRAKTLEKGITHWDHVEDTSNISDNKRLS